MCVCYAGVVENGVLGTRRAAQALAGGATVEDIAQVLAKFSSDGTVDFLVATTGEQKSITRVRREGIESDLEHGWIGDHDAFSWYQKARLTIEPNAIAAEIIPEDSMLLCQMDDAMQEVIRTPEVPGVDDFCIRVASFTGAFNYLAGLFTYVERDVELKDGDNLLSKMMLPAQDGGFTACIVAPEEPGTPAIGIHFPQARLTVLYMPLTHDEPELVRDTAGQDLPQVVQDRFGVRLSAPMVAERRAI
jgi:hypothetical protein